MMFLGKWRFAVYAFIGLFLVAAVPLTLAALLVYPRLPDLSALTDYHPKVPLRVYTAEGALIGEYGEERRDLVSIDQVPLHMRQAILAAEDDRFYQHHGIDYVGVARAALANLVSHGAREGASTITMQVARNFFLSSEKTFTRKLSEALLSWKIEHSLTKDQILQLYLNQIYLGQRAYGFEAAAETYFGKTLNQVNIAEMAMLAGLPKGPSRYNPVVNPERARARQLYVLRRMRDLRWITPDEYEQAVNAPLQVHRTAQKTYPVAAEYVAEMVRQAMIAKYGDSIYTSGMSVYTTLRRDDQEAAGQALVQGVVDYDRRHGWRGPEARLALADPGDAAAVDAQMAGFEPVAGLLPAVVVRADARQVELRARGAGAVTVGGDGLALVRRALAAGDAGGLRPGAVVRVVRNARGDWAIAQLPQVEAAFVSLDPKTGAVRAMVGGFDYNRSKFNHVTQAWRQPGSSFKPLIYSAALEKGLTPDTVFDDGPLSLPDGNGGLWEPQNYEGEREGPMPLRRALALSSNMVSIRVLQTIGAQYAQDYVKRFGIPPEKNPAYLTMALGTASVTPMMMANAYAVFANGGYRVKPYLIDRVLDSQGRVLAQAPREAAGENAPRVLAPRNVAAMYSMMQGVIQYGTGAAAAKLGRHDLAGKTGTTNDQNDGWFCGFNGSVVGVAWMGFDKPRNLGHGETGANTALPIWIRYMERVLKGQPETPPPLPAPAASPDGGGTDGADGADVADGAATANAAAPDFFYQGQDAPADGAPPPAVAAPAPDDADE